MNILKGQGSEIPSTDPKEQENKNTTLLGNSKHFVNGLKNWVQE